MQKKIIILLHTGYWLLYLFLLFCFLIFIPGVVRQGNLGRPLLLLFTPPIAINFILSAVTCFYTFYAIFFQRILSKKKFLLLFLAASATCILVACACLLNTAAFFPENFNLSLKEKTGMIVFIGALSAVHGMIALIMRGFITWYADIKLKEELARKNFETELALVKSQINPHFLFNTISNIDMLILKDGEKASAFLNRLSDIMRFMLYETKTEKITLQKELDYIGNYIELQKIRSTNPNYIDYSIDGTPGQLLIAPMLFIPFIENAFTYAMDNKVDNAIKIIFRITSTKLYFICENRYKQNSIEKQHGGLGLDLIKKRLSLTYPHRHTLTISSKNEIFTATLCLDLNES